MSNPSEEPYYEFDGDLFDPQQIKDHCDKILSVGRHRAHMNPLRCGLKYITNLVPQCNSFLSSHPVPAILGVSDLNPDLQVDVELQLLELYYIQPWFLTKGEAEVYEELADLQGGIVPYFFGLLTITTPCGEDVWVLVLEHIPSISRQRILSSESVLMPGGHHDHIQTARLVPMKNIVGIVIYVAKKSLNKNYHTKALVPQLLNVPMASILRMEYEQRPALCDVLMAQQIFCKSKNGQKRPARHGKNLKRTLLALALNSNCKTYIRGDIRGACRVMFSGDMYDKMGERSGIEACGNDKLGMMVSDNRQRNDSEDSRASK
ncbi:hypothetical protein DFH08DRAFT_802435 [Mycena albidolilacea]|uniref:Uncharacterized protein n=1 Tax=Mycena albidolilacea TaxID=1033008 RepID=A0AAD7AHJ7_9AGAR|nr:hypothetical protein DFH08DRAFT_802435 [Mycena albidolilacea]